jgi:hypothetical protein
VASVRPKPEDLTVKIRVILAQLGSPIGTRLGTRLGEDALSFE